MGLTSDNKQQIKLKEGYAKNIKMLKTTNSRANFIDRDEKNRDLSLIWVPYASIRNWP